MMRMHFKRYVYLAMFTMLLQFIVFKYCYPYPNFMQDSYNYLRSAYTNADANMWPVGYAKLIRAVGFFTHWDTALIFVQYCFYHICALYFFFTLLDLTSVGKWPRRLIFAFLFLNPAILYLGNYVTSDVYFIGISLIWISQLFRLVYQASKWLLAAHLLVLLLAYTVRYHALIYPVISITVIVFCPFSVRVKIASGLIMTGMIGGFMLYTTWQSEKVMGTRQFSAFSGWQMANNAVHAYAHMPERPPLQVPPQFAAIHSKVNAYIDSLQHIPMSQRPDGPLMAFYLWDATSPLQPSPGAVNIADNAAHLRQMAAVAPLYNDYGKYLISQHPASYFRYFLLPNFFQYAYPPVENLGVYNDGRDTVWPVAQTWFRYPSNKVYTRSNQKELVLFDYYPALMVFIMLLFISGWIAYYRVSGPSFADMKFRNALRIGTFYWIVHYGFSVLASPVVLRYQLFNMILGVVFGVLLWELVLQAKMKTNKLPNPT
ncbi:hypothetical protein [Chitinophaga filiformis]|uniref:Dolichyl-phosphate-mannose-protein mannosyltransferase n=1 Tax=Chitinophaga filiformis TaxID=104663 RepID=A0ABY4I3P2_CHIFI|nr:hypothetical protein [Chitinophaga filiformis]UPK69743.1 hypothetical protein MYF79_00380 [Chitinophaga filiformis]